MDYNCKLLSSFDRFWETNLEIVPICIKCCNENSFVARDNETCKGENEGDKHS